jgi:plasmid stabilization system protein ParE
MRVGFSRFVESDLDAIADYIAHDNPERAETFLDEIDAEIQLIGKNPQLYRLRPEIGSGIRMGIVGRYAILFRIAETMIVIERVVHAGRDLPHLPRG